MASDRHRSHHHDLSGATHTLELRQVAEVNAAIGAGRWLLTPADLRVEHAPAELGAAPLRRLVMQGSPSFGYLFGLFAPAADEPDVRRHGVLLHTEHLLVLSRTLHLHHHWGLAGGSAPTR